MLLRCGKTFLLIAALSVVAAPTLAYKKEYRAAKDYMKAGAYSQALEQYEAALQSPKLSSSRTRAKIESELAGAKQKVAVEKFALGNRLEQRGEMLGALNAYQKAVQYAPSNADYQSRYQRVKQTFDTIKTRAIEILESARRNNDWEAALARFDRLDQQQSAVPEVIDARNRLSAEASQYYEQRSDRALPL